MVQCSLFPIPLFLGLQNENAEKNISTIVSRSKFYLVHIILLLNSHLDLMSEEKIGIVKITLYYIMPGKVPSYSLWKCSEGMRKQMFVTGWH